MRTSIGLGLALSFVVTLSAVTANAQGKTAPCLGNLVNGLGEQGPVVNSLDLTSLLNVFGAKISRKSSSSVIAADLNNDAVVDGSDLTVLLSAWGACPAVTCTGDFNGDRLVNSADLSVVLSGLSKDGLTFVGAGYRMDGGQAMMSVLSNFGQSCSKQTAKVPASSPIAQKVTPLKTKAKR